jgi:hypothetical protein
MKEIFIPFRQVRKGGVGLTLSSLLVGSEAEQTFSGEVFIESKASPNEWRIWFGWGLAWTLGRSIDLDRVFLAQ